MPQGSSNTAYRSACLGSLKRMPKRMRGVSVVVARAAADVPALHHWLQEPRVEQHGTLIVVLDVRRFHNAVVLFLKPFERLQCSCKCRVALRFVWRWIHEFTLLFAEILLCYCFEIYFFINLKSTLLF